MHWLKKLMELTPMSWDFKLLLLLLGVAYLAIALAAEMLLFPAVARLIGRMKLAITAMPKKRKQYKLIQEGMRT